MLQRTVRCGGRFSPADGGPPQATGGVDVAGFLAAYERHFSHTVADLRAGRRRLPHISAVMPHPPHVRNGLLVCGKSAMNRYLLIDPVGSALPEQPHGIVAACHFLRCTVAVPGNPSYPLLRERYRDLVAVLREVVTTPIVPTSEVVPREGCKILHSLYTFRRATDPATQGAVDDPELHDMCAVVMEKLPSAWPLPPMWLGNFDPEQRLSLLEDSSELRADH